MAFATTTDVRKRLEKASLSTEETDDATGLLDLATAVICEAVGKADDAWLTGLTATKQKLIKGFTVELVCRAMASPQGLVAASETLGAHTRSETYRRDSSSAIVLTPTEERVIRGFVYGSTTATTDSESFVDRITDLAEGRDVDEDS